MAKPSQRAIDTTKNVAIAVLLTAIVGFYLGIQYQQNQQQQLDAAVQSAVESVEVPAKK